MIRKVRPHEITRELVLKQNPKRNADTLYTYFLLITLLTKSLPFRRKLLHSAHKTLQHKIGHEKFGCTTAIWRPSLKLSPLLIHAVEKRLVKSQLVPVLAHFNAGTAFFHCNLADQAENTYLKIGSFSELQHAVLHKAVRPCKQLLNDFCKRQTSSGAQTSLRKSARVAFSHCESGDDLSGRETKKDRCTRRLKTNVMLQ